MPDTDPALLERLMAERGALTGDPEAGWITWIRAVAEHEWLALLRSLDVPAGVAWGGAAVLGVLAVAAVQLVLWALRHRKKAPVDPMGAEPWLGDDADVFSLDQARALLAAGQRREASRHAWLWLAEGIARRGMGERVADQTHGEFVRTVDQLSPGWPARRELAQLAGEADRLCYASDAPSDDVVAGWFSRVQVFRAQVGATGPRGPK